MAENQEEVIISEIEKGETVQIQTEDPKKYFFKREIDLVALLALLLSLSVSLGSLGWHFYKRAQGAQLKLFPTDFVMLIADQMNEGHPVMRIGARLSYINTSDPGYNAAVKAEFVEVTINGIPYRQESLERVFFDSQKLPKECPEQKIEEKLDVQGIKSFWGKVTAVEGKQIYNCGSDPTAYKIIVKNTGPINMVMLGGSGVSSETFFYPVKHYYYPNNAKEIPENRVESWYLRWDKLIDSINIKDEIEDYLTFTYGVETWDNELLSKTCKIRLEDNDWYMMKEAGFVTFDQRCL